MSDNYIAEKPSSIHSSSLVPERIMLPQYTWIKLKCNASSFNANTGQYRSHTRNANSRNDIQWFKDGRPIEQDTRRMRKSSGENINYVELEIYSIDVGDSGLYQCKRNSRIYKNIELIVSKGISLSHANKYTVIVMISLATLVRYFGMK